MSEIFGMTVFQFVSLLLGSGIFVVLLRTMFVVGQYAQRVVHLEGALSNLTIAVDKLRDKVTA